MSSPNKPTVPVAPVVDEWGIYDPERAGLAALFDKLEATVPSREDALKMAASMREAAELRKEN